MINTTKLVNKYFAGEENGFEMEVQVRYIINNFEDEVYIEISLLENEEEIYEITFDELKSRGKLYSLAKQVEEDLSFKEMNVNFKRVVYQ